MYNMITDRVADTQILREQMVFPRPNPTIY